jgi:hypothetical protein
MQLFMAGILVMGMVRFALTMSGMSDSVVKYFSMTAVIVAGMLYFSFATATHKERLIVAYLLIFPYMIIEVAALGYTWASGHPTIFHSADYSMGFPIAEHTIGHLVGGLTWEPLSVFVVMEVIWVIFRGVRYVLGR